MNPEENNPNITPEPVVHYEGTGTIVTKEPMKSMNQLGIPVAIVIAGMFIAGAIFFSNNRAVPTVAAVAKDGAAQNAPAINVAPEDIAIKADDHVYGPKDAEIILVEWSDPECPFCKRHHDTLTQLMQKYPGKIAWVYRHFTLDFHTYAKTEAASMECAADIGGNEAFWKYTDELFKTTNGNNSLKREDLTKIALASGLDKAKFDACVDSGKFADRVERDQQNGLKVGVQGTPFTIAYNRKTKKQTPINGAQPITMIQPIIDALLK